ncbi:Hypothetical predicted protein [Olea europaea subsp. europaea]|uniref:Uncharacterized protein n=1 Tax=Olea europaea subsp. europaea TaxID=158383 RepID=A0A8S0PN25_OLEEU|nr:Hypothetical predicted protein [Olea europaea subsp. europaea]
MNVSQISASYVAFLDIVRKNARNGNLQWRHTQLLITPMDLGHELEQLQRNNDKGDYEELTEATNLEQSLENNCTGNNEEMIEVTNLEQSLIQTNSIFGNQTEEINKDSGLADNLSKNAHTVTQLDSALFKSLRDSIKDATSLTRRWKRVIRHLIRK